MPKKVLIFSTSYLPLVGGAELAIKEITNRMEENFSFDLIVARQNSRLPKIEKIGPITVYRIGIGIKTLDKLIVPFWGAIVALRLNEKNKYHAYWCIMTTYASGAAYIANIFSSRKVPIVLTLQEGDSESHFSKRWFGLINLSWKLALKRTHLLTAISYYLASRATAFGYKGQIKIIPNGVDIENFTKEISVPEREEIKKELGLKEGEIALMTVSRLVIKNGIGDVIKALPLLDEKIKFIVIGDGYMKEELQKLVTDLKVADRVFFKGYVEHSEMPKYLKASDIFIRPSISEGLGNSFIEAMAAGIPVIATPVGGIVDFLYEGETGYFCKPENPESVAEAVDFVINDPKKSEIVENAKKMAVQKYDWNNIAEQMKEIFDNMAK